MYFDFVWLLGQVCFCFYTVNNILLAQSDTLTIKQDTPAVDTSIVESNDQQPLIVINEPIPIKVYGKILQEVLVMIVNRYNM